MNFETDLIIKIHNTKIWEKNKKLIKETDKKITNRNKRTKFTHEIGEHEILLHFPTEN